MLSPFDGGDIMNYRGKKRLSSLVKSALGGAIALSLATSTALAQTDRLLDEPGGAAAQRTVTTIDCDFPTLTVVRTENTPITFANTGFLNLPGSSISFETFGNRCVKVHFTAKANATNSCIVRALLNGAVMNPNGGSLQTLVSFDTTPNAHAYAWAGNVGDGTHTVVIQRRVGQGTCTIDDWTVDLEVWDF